MLTEDPAATSVDTPVEPPTRARRLGVLALATVALAVAYLLLYPGTFRDRPPVPSPQHNVTSTLSDRMSDGFRYELPHADRLPGDISIALTPRDAARDGDDVVPKDFAGSMILFGILSAIWRPLVWLVSPIAAAVGAIQLVRIVESLPRGPRDARTITTAGALALILWVVYPPLIITGSQVFATDSVSLAFVLTAVLAFIRYWRNARQRDLIVFVAALSAGVLFRYPNALLAVPLGVALLATKRVGWRDIGVAGVTAAPFALLLLAFNQAVYGSATVTGYTLGGDLIRDTVNVGSTSLFKFDPAVAASFLRPYVLESPMLLAVPLIGLAIGVARARRSPDRALIVALLAGAGLVILFHIGHPAWGRDRVVVNASILRYLLPASALGIAFVARAIAPLMAARRRAATLLVSALVLASVATAWFGFAGVDARARFVSWHQLVRDEVIEHTEPDALIASQLADKVLFPERQTLTLTYLVQNEQPIELGASRAWDHLPDGDRFADVAGRVHAAGFPLYLLYDFDDPALLEQYRVSLADRGFALRPIPDTESPLYAISRAASRG